VWGLFPNDGCWVDAPAALASDWSTSNNLEGSPIKLAVVAEPIASRSVVEQAGCNDERRSRPIASLSVSSSSKYADVGLIACPDEYAPISIGV